jgi:hypothetical protein
MKTGRRIGSALSVGLLVTIGLASAAFAQSGGRNEYAVKFVCGVNARPNISQAAAVGAYFTAINIHNPLSDAVPLVHKVALAEPGRPARPTPLTSPFRLGYDEAVEIDCPQIDRLLSAAGIPHGPFFTGFYVIQSQTELDVVAVYSAAGTRGGAVTTMHTERVPVRRRGG